jgi:hypothetical protein
MLQQKALLTLESSESFPLAFIPDFLLRSCSYMLRMLEPNPLVQPNEERAKRQCLLMIVLSLIELEGLQKISSRMLSAVRSFAGWRLMAVCSVDLWTKLKKVDVEEGVDHPFFGHPERILKALVEEKYRTPLVSACFTQDNTL